MPYDGLDILNVFAGNGYMSDGTKPLFDVMVIFTRGQFWPLGIVVACVCVCVYQSLACPHDNLSPVREWVGQ